MARFHVLDSFRGISAISVVVFHIHAVNSLTEWDFFRNAYLFVPFFFSLSAFVLSHRYSPQDFDLIELKHMLNNRIFRLWPLHIAMLLVFLILEGGKLLAESKGIEFTYPAFAGENSATEILPNLFLVQSWINSCSNLSFNYPTWSISVEMGLYLLLAAILYFFKALRSYAFSFIALFSFILLIKGIDHLRTNAYIGLFCFSLGALTYILYDKIKYVTLSRQLMTGLEIASVTLVLFIITLDGGNKYIISGPVFCLAILIFAFEGGTISRILKLNPFTYLGRISYSIYMTHAAVIFCVTAVLKILSKTINIPFLEMRPIVNAGSNITVSYFNLGTPHLLNNGLVLLILLTVIVLSNFTYRFIEQPGQRLGQLLTSKRSDINRKSTAKGLI